MKPIQIISIGPPPEQHADRIIAAMLRELAVRHANLAATILDAWGFAGSRIRMNGSPRAQRKTAERMRRSGAWYVHLEPGTRGRYSLSYAESSGWDPERHAEITANKPLPPRPWLAVWRSKLN